jgi:hypothetical protein
MKADIIQMAREAGLAHFYDSEGHCTGITDQRLITEEKERNDDRLVDILAPFSVLVAKKCADIADTAEPYQSADLIRKHFGVEK